MNNTTKKLMEKQCTKCKEFKELRFFSKNPSSSTGLRGSCKICDAKQKKNKPRAERVVPEGTKVCGTCKVEMSLDNFARNTTKADNLNYECKACEKSRRMERKAKDINYAAFYLPVNHY